MSEHDYFKGINYSLGNEDTSLELGIVKKINAKKIVSVTGSGGRSLPLLAYHCTELTCADLSQEQQNMAKLREATYKQLTYHEFMQFWGYAPFGDHDYSHHRKVIFNHLELEKDVKDFFLKLFEVSHWQSLLYKGKWEKTFKILAKICQKMMGKNYDKIFSFHNLEDQLRFYNESFPMLKWKAVLLLLGNKHVFDALLYKGHFIEKNVPESHFQYYFKAFESIFTQQLARQSFFLNLCFYGKIAHEDANPIEAKKETFDLLHKKLNKKDAVALIYEKNDILSVIEKKEKGSIDFISLSDVPSYFHGDEERDFLQRILPALSQGALVVVRSYLRVPAANEAGYEDVTDKYSELINDEAVQMYRVQVLKKK